MTDLSALSPEDLILAVEEVQARLRAAETQLRETHAKLQKSEDAWHRLVAGTECSNCGHHVVMRDDEDAAEELKRLKVEIGMDAMRAAVAMCRTNGFRDAGRILENYLMDLQMGARPLSLPQPPSLAVAYEAALRLIASRDPDMQATPAEFARQVLGNAPWSAVDRVEQKARRDANRLVMLWDETLIALVHAAIEKHDSLPAGAEAEYQYGYVQGLRAAWEASTAIPGAPETHPVRPPPPEDPTP